jgi:uncharacterized metal-binding protein YceD (DUF177 family)
MLSLEQFKIDLKALTEDVTPLDYQLDDQFFSALDGAEIQSGSLHVSGSIRKTVGFFELQLSISGTVQIPCDRCLDMMAQPIETTLCLMAKLGDVAGTPVQRHDDVVADDIVIVDETEGLLDISWSVYESIVLAVPIQHVHQPGDCNDAMMRVLSEHSTARSSDADAKQDIDPRWNALKKLKV